MGIGVGVVDLLIQLRAAGHLRPGCAVAELGAQQLARSYFQHPDRVALLRQLIAQPLPPIVDIPPPINDPTDVLDSNAPMAEGLWRSLGFDYLAIDIDGSPRSMAIDLNCDGIPSRFKGKFDLVTNFGTTEHVANQLNAFQVIHDLTAPKGLMVHMVPVQGYLNHGLINYNFKFFWMLARSNGYRFIEAGFYPEMISSDLPDNIQSFLNEVNLSSRERSYKWTSANAGMLAVLRKDFDIEFVAPIDVNTGSTTSNETLKKRYWTVFHSHVFEQLETGRSAADIAANSAPSRSSRNNADIATPIEASDHNDGGEAPASFQFDTQEDKRNRLAGQFTSKVISAARTKGMAPVMKLFRRFREKNSLAHGLASQSDLLSRKFDAVIEGIANQSDLINRKFETLTKAVNELREVQKAQLVMQRSAAEEIRKAATIERKEQSSSSGGKGV